MLQKEIEKIQESNQNLEQDFEKEIDKKNQNSMETGSIINSIQNIFALCRKLAEEKGKKIPPISVEGQKDFVGNLMTMLETSSDHLEDLVSVLKDLNKEYKYEDIDKDQLYEELEKAEQAAALAQSKSITPGLDKQSDIVIGSSGIGEKNIGKPV